MCILYGGKSLSVYVNQGGWKFAQTFLGIAMK
jgi:hypothetical protein